MTNKERIEVATRWMTAMSSTGVKPLKALADVLDENVYTSSFAGKDAVIKWFKTGPGRAMFATGTWQPPTVKGDVVTAVCSFHPKAAYHEATLSITVGSSGLITEAKIFVAAAPDPLGTVIDRVWGKRVGLARLPDHLASTYGITVKTTKQLDHGVLRVDLAKGGPWIVRLFPSDRPIADVKADAAVLRFLESKGFPAERCVADVSVHEDQGVLVTAFIKGPKPPMNTANQRKLGDLVGRLHAMTGAPKTVRRGVGALHLYTTDCTIASEIATARASLEAAAFRGTDKAWETQRAGLAAAGDFASMPKALMHPDPGCVNAIASGSQPVLIDWAGAGYGPRVLGLGLLLVACAKGKTFNREWTDAIMQAYTQHVKLKPAELDQLDAAIAHRPLIHEAYSWGVGMATQRKPASRKDWPYNNEGIAKMCDHIRQTWS
jgi:Ser/Thr protein kinase RdoA (MazF antagonist)